MSGWKSVLELLGKASARFSFACPGWVPYRLRMLPCSCFVVLIRITYWRWG